jgi:hypothetical protein
VNSRSGRSGRGQGFPEQETLCARMPCAVIEISHADKHHSAFQRTVVAMDCCKYRPKFGSLADAWEGIRLTPGTPEPRHILGLYLFRDHMNHNQENQVLAVYYIPVLTSIFLPHAHQFECFGDPAAVIAISGSTARRSGSRISVEQAYPHIEVGSRSSISR